MNREVCGSKWLWYTLWYYSNIYLDWLRKPKRSFGWLSSEAFGPEYESGASKKLGHHWWGQIGAVKIKRNISSSVGIATGYGLEDFESRWGKNFYFSMSSRPALRSTQSPILFPGGLSGRDVKLTTHLQLVPRPRKCGSTHPLPVRPHAFMT
jgi:hypothetical protein